MLLCFGILFQQKRQMSSPKSLSAQLSLLTVWSGKGLNMAHSLFVAPIISGRHSSSVPLVSVLPLLIIVIYGRLFGLSGSQIR